MNRVPCEPGVPRARAFEEAFFAQKCCVYEKTVELNATSCSNTPRWSRLLK